MKKLSLSAFLVLLLAFGASAHEGSIGLYGTLSHAACDEDITQFVAADITIFYYRSDAGPDGINGAQFMIDMGGAVGAVDYIEQATTWPANTLQLGTSIYTGISTVWQQECYGASSDWIWIGTINVIWMTTSTKTITVVADPGAIDPSAPHVSICDVAKTQVNVLGGFYLACDPTDPSCSCNTATEGSTWGAIKGMYR
ncbi:MAG: hypothetical protein JW876_04080 [Candidatus Krumholzibacteriota bacterium]|nr:hypothetical protein [Candidatus Krumholzibacteriota bacterium]